MARRALELMALHNIPVSPANYEIWLTHLSGADPNLSREVQTRIDSGEPFTDAVSETLFERFFANTRLTAEIVHTSESIARELSCVVSTLRDAGSQTGTYADTLQDAATQIDGGLESTDLRSLLSSLATATRAILDNNRQLSLQMETSSQQVAKLQTTLQAVKVEALTDGLTGLANRRDFDEVLSKHINDDKCGDLCLIMLDIDHFKRLNDAWGHLIGDQVIRFIATVLRHHTPVQGSAARYGGEEFAIILPNNGFSNAVGIASAIHQMVRSKKLTQRSTGAVIGAVTISIGVAQYRKGESATNLIGRADSCLYASKRGGRDRITTDQDLARASAA